MMRMMLPPLHVCTQYSISTASSPPLMLPPLHVCCPSLNRRFIKVTDRYDGTNFLTQIDGVRVFTPLVLVLAVIEISDVIFAVDSIPAVCTMVQCVWWLCVAVWVHMMEMCGCILVPPLFTTKTTSLKNVRSLASLSIPLSSTPPTSLPSSRSERSTLSLLCLWRNCAFLTRQWRWCWALLG